MLDMRALAISVLAAVAVLSRPARAVETVGVIAVAPPPGPTPALVDLTGQLRRAVAERVVGVLEPAQLRARMGDEAPGSSLSETSRMYEAARAAELSGDPQRAIVGLRATIKELESFPESEEVFALWSRAMLRLAKVESLLAGHEDEARDTMERLLRADPWVKVDPDVHGPDVVQLCDSVKTALGRLEKRRLTVSSQSTAVRVFVNGREVGDNAKGPVVLKLPLGRYRVSGYRGKLRAPPVTIDLGAKDHELALDFAIPEVLRPAQGPGLATSPLDTSRIFGAAGFLRLDTVVATNTVENDGVTYLVGSVYDVRNGRLKLAGVMRLYNEMPPTGGMDALADFLLTGEKKKGPVTPYDPLHPDLPKVPFPGGPEQPTVSTTKGWVAFGTGIGAVAFAGVSVWQAISSKNSYDSAKKLLLPDGSLPFDRTRYDSLTADGDSAKRNAIIAGAGAGVCLVTTGVLGYLSYKQTGDVGPFRF
jgi:hypothetical protein